MIKEKRDQIINIALTKEEKRTLKENAYKELMNIAQYIRSKCL